MFKHIASEFNSIIITLLSSKNDSTIIGAQFNKNTLFLIHENQYQEQFYCVFGKHPTL